MRLLLLAVAALGWADAAPAVNPTTTRLYSQPHRYGNVVATFRSGTVIDVKTCTGGIAGWCAVTVEHQQGWMLRANLKVGGTCRSLRALGLGDLHRHEASYRRERDPNRNGVACERDEQP